MQDFRAEQSGGDEPWLDGIEGEAPRELIRSDAPLIRVIAGPGAGKTTCLKRRTQRLLHQATADEGSVLVGTFTRAIASNMSDDLGDAAKVSTLHSLATGLLHDYPAARQGFSLRFLLAYEESAMLYDIADQVAAKDQGEREKQLKRLQSARSERIELPDAAFAGAVAEWLRLHGGMLVGDAPFLALEGLAAEDIPSGEYDHVVIDEYQDLTAAEQELVERLWSEEGSLVVMGDNDQSIYSFRHNHPRGIDEFPDRWAPAEVLDVPIADNRRCGEEILNLANRLMAEGGTTKAPMLPASKRTGSFTAVQWDDFPSEVEGLAQYIEGREDETFLVLVPRRFIGYALADRLGDVARTAFQEEPLEHSLARERFALGSALAEPDDLIALRAWLGFVHDGNSDAPQRNAAAYASLPPGQNAAQLWQRLNDDELDPQGTGTKNVLARIGQLKEHADAFATVPLRQACMRLFDPDLASPEIEPDDLKRRLLRGALQALRDGSLDLIDHEGADSLGPVMNGLRYRVATRAPLVPDRDGDGTGPRVNIMTLHSAKGLEADNVILAGAAGGMLPGPRLADPQEDADHRAEQRRLLYVAITRAKESLVISWPRLLDFGLARSNWVREDRVQWRGYREGDVVLGKSELLPVVEVTRGRDWRPNE